MKKLITILFLIFLSSSALAAANLWEFSIETNTPFLSFADRKEIYETWIRPEENYKGTIKQNGVFLDYLYYLKENYGLDQYISDYVNPIGSDILGAQLAVGGELYYLSGSGIGSSDTTMNLTKFGYTKPDGTYQTFTMTNFGTLGCGTVQPGTIKKQEFISFTGITQNSDGTAQLTGLSRGLERFSPYSASTTLRTAHAGGSQFVISNSPPCFYENYTSKNNAETISAKWTFGILPESSTNATTSTQFVTKGLLDNTVLQGASTSTETNGGIVELATQTEMASSTDYGADKPLVLQAKNATSSCQIADKYAVITQIDGKIDSNCIDQTEAYSWSGGTIIASSTFTSYPRISAAGNPVNAADVATKNYVDTSGSSKADLIASSTENIIESDGGQTMLIRALISGNTLATGNVLKGRGYIDFDWVSGQEGSRQTMSLAFGNGTTWATTSSYDSQQTDSLGKRTGFLDFEIIATSANSQEMSFVADTSSSTPGRGISQFGNGSGTINNLADQYVQMLINNTSLGFVTTFYNYNIWIMKD